MRWCLAFGWLLAATACTQPDVAISNAATLDDLATYSDSQATEIVVDLDATETLDVGDTGDAAANDALDEIDAPVADIAISAKDDVMSLDAPDSTDVLPVSVDASGDTNAEDYQPATPNKVDTSDYDKRGWPPWCVAPHFVGDGPGGDPNQTCFALPTSWCANPPLSQPTPACSADASACCMFPTTCLPCGWVSCALCPQGPDCPAQCQVQTSPWNSASGDTLWKSDTCNFFVKEFANDGECGFCETFGYCQWW